MTPPKEICDLCHCSTEDAALHQCSKDQQADEQLRKKHELEDSFLKDGFWLHFPPILDTTIGK